MSFQPDLFETTHPVLAKYGNTYYSVAAISAYRADTYSIVEISEGKIINLIKTITRTANSPEKLEARLEKVCTKLYRERMKHE